MRGADEVKVEGEGALQYERLEMHRRSTLDLPMIVASIVAIADLWRVF